MGFCFQPGFTEAEVVFVLWLRSIDFRVRCAHFSIYRNGVKVSRLSKSSGLI